GDAHPHLDAADDAEGALDRVGVVVHEAVDRQQIEEGNVTSSRLDGARRRRGVGIGGDVDGRFASVRAFGALIAQRRLLDRAQVGRRLRAAQVVHRHQLFRVALLDQGAGAGGQVGDVVDRLGALGVVVQIRPFGVDATGLELADQTVEGARVNLVFRADTVHDRVQEVWVEADDLVRVVGVAVLDRGVAGVHANGQRLVRQGRIL